MPTLGERLRAAEEAVKARRRDRPAVNLYERLSREDLKKQLDAVLARRSRNTSVAPSVYPAEEQRNAEVVREIEWRAEEKREREMRGLEVEAELRAAEQRREAMIAPYRGRDQGPRIEPDAV